MPREGGGTDCESDKDEYAKEIVDIIGDACGVNPWTEEDVDEDMKEVDTEADFADVNQWREGKDASK